MEDLGVKFALYMKQANASMAEHDYDAAHKNVILAAECLLLLAKKSTGKAQDKYIENYKTIKLLIRQIEEKKNSYNEALRMMAQSKAEAAEAQKLVEPEKKIEPVEPVKKVEPTQPTATEYGNALKPMRLSDYLGQPRAVAAVTDMIRASLLKNSAMPHIIIYGSHGLGKTTFANIIANEMHVNFIEINGSKITASEMIAILRGIKPKDIIFIDEIHTLSLSVAESVLYSAMQDGRISFNEGKGDGARPVTVNLPPFTLIGATTEIGKLAKPFIQRAVQIRLEEYSDELIAGIITNLFNKLGMGISGDMSLYIAARCRNNPRTASSIVKRISDKALVRYAEANDIGGFGSLSTADAVRRLGISIDRAVVDDFFTENGIDAHGLETGDRELLRIIITRYGGGPVGLDNLARAMNESNNVIAQKYESYLIKKGYLRVEREGRVVMPAAYEALGMPTPTPQIEENEKKKPGETDKKKTELGKRSIMAASEPDMLKCRKIEDMIVYPENVVTTTKELAELFPDVKQPFEDEATHVCELEIEFDNFNRTVVCDSVLESRFAKVLAAVGYVRDIKAQTLEIPYISHELADRRYFPDFVIRDYMDRIAVIEMKNFDMVSYHLNIDKYEHLKRFCERRGYGYAEVMKPYDSDVYVSVNMLMQAPVDKHLEAFIIETIEQSKKATGEGVFTENDFRKYMAEHKNIDRSALYTVLLNNRTLKNVDRLGKSIKIISE